MGWGGRRIPPRTATTDTTTMMAISAPCESCPDPELPPDAPAASFTSPPALAEPWPLSGAKGSSVASGKSESDAAVAIMFEMPGLCLLSGYLSFTPARRVPERMVAT